MENKQESEGHPETKGEDTNDLPKDEDTNDLQTSLREIIDLYKNESVPKNDISKALGDSVVEYPETLSSHEQVFEKIKSEYYTENNEYKKYNECAARGIELIYKHNRDYEFFQDQSEGEINVKPPSFFPDSNKKYTSKDIENHFNKYYMKNCLFCILGRHSHKQTYDIDSVMEEINQAIVQVKEMDKISDEDIKLFNLLKNKIRFLFGKKPKTEKNYKSKSIRYHFMYSILYKFDELKEQAKYILFEQSYELLSSHYEGAKDIFRFFRTKTTPDTQVGNAKKRKLYYDELFKNDRSRDKQLEIVNFLIDEANKKNIQDTFYYKYLSGQHAKIEHVGGKMKKKTKKSNKKNRKTRKRQRKSKKN